MTKNSLRYHRRKPPFEHAEITAPGLYDIREYDFDEAEWAKEDGKPFADINPIRQYQILVWDGGQPWGLVYSDYTNGDLNPDSFPVENLWCEEWITQRQVAR